MVAAILHAEANVIDEELLAQALVEEVSQCCHYAHLPITQCSNVPVNTTIDTLNRRNQVGDT
jgi:hypothetical protein